MLDPLCISTHSKSRQLFKFGGQITKLQPIKSETFFETQCTTCVSLWIQDLAESAALYRYSNISTY